MEYLLARVFILCPFPEYGIILDVDFDEFEYEEIYCIQLDDGSIAWLYIDEFVITD